jgi:hypothetical protein
MTLDDDVAAGLDEAARQSRLSYREVVNSALRRGLEVAPDQGMPYHVDARPMSRRPGVDIDDVSGLLDLLDGPSAR